MLSITLFLLGCCASAIAAGCSKSPPAAPAGSTSDYDGSSLLVTYTCNDGLGFPSTTGSKMNVQVICNSEGNWEVFEGQSLQECIPIRCPNPPPAAPTGSTSDYNSSSLLITYTCNDGLGFPSTTGSKRNVQVKCNSEGTWEVFEGQQLQDCIQIRCPNPPPEAPAGSTSDYNGSSLLVTYTCNDGLGFPSTTGSKWNVQVICNSEGTWEVSEGQQLQGCIPIRCPNEPPAPPAGSTSDYNGSSLLVTYTCNDGLGFPSTTGSKQNVQMKCNSEGIWEVFEGQQLQDCIRIRCSTSPPEAPVGSTSDYNGSSVVNTVVTYSCSDGWSFPLGTDSKPYIQVKCNSDGTWTVLEGQQLENCTRIGCSTSPPEAPVGSTSDYNGSSVVNTVVTYSCIDGWNFPLRTDSKPYVQVKCNSDGNWTVLEGQQLQNCIRIGCLASPPQPPLHSTSDYNGSSVQGTVVTYTCNDGLGFPSTTESKPNIQVKCNSDGTWEVLGSQQLQECIPIGNNPQRREEKKEIFAT